jgi:hypothetical protein
MILHASRQHEAMLVTTADALSSRSISYNAMACFTTASSNPPDAHSSGNSLQIVKTTATACFTTA